MTDSAAPTLNKAPAITLDRSLPDPDVVERHEVRLADQVAATADRRLGELAEESAMLASAASGFDQGLDGAKEDEELRNHLFRQLMDGMVRQLPPFEFMLPPGTRIVGPPYDGLLSTGSGVTAADAQQTGEFSIAVNDGASNAGIWLHLTVDQTADVAITPAGWYRYLCMATGQGAPTVRSEGRLGMSAYVDGDQQPAVVREATLWDISGLQYGNFVQGDGKIAEAHSPPFGLGAIYLAPLIIRMHPGHNYFVCIWCWQVSHQAQNARGGLTVSVPCVRVDAGPPMVVN